MQTQLHVLVSNSPRRSGGGFSLVELLAVIAIMAVLGAAVAPAFHSIGSAGKLSTGTAAVSSGLAIARNQAIATRRLTRFVVPSDWSDTPSANFRKFSIWQFEPDQGAAGAWVQVSKWENLPEGVVFDSSLSKTYMDAAPSLTNNPQAVQGPDAFQAGTAANEDTFASGTSTFKGRYIEFSPRGGLRSVASSQPVTWFTLVEGFIDGQDVRYTRGGSSPSNWRQISVGTLLGRATVYSP